jgi:membrane protein YdbS with pleckstrin-like domain
MSSSKLSLKLVHQLKFNNKGILGEASNIWIVVAAVTWIYFFLVISIFLCPLILHMHSS